MKQDALNIFMSNKSLFEKLFEEVMQDESDLKNLGISPEQEGGSEEGGFDGEEEGGSEDVTISMDRETAQKLHDLLASVLGGDVKADEEMEGEEPKEKEDTLAFGDQADEEEGDDEDEEMEDEDSEEQSFRESPEAETVKGGSKGSGYKPFNIKQGDHLMKKSSMKGPGIQTKNSLAGSASQTTQTAPTAHYMKASTSYKDGKGSGNQVSANIKKGDDLLTR
jgi:hypothetical protein